MVASAVAGRCGLIGCRKSEIPNERHRANKQRAAPDSRFAVDAQSALPALEVDYLYYRIGCYRGLWAAENSAIDIQIDYGDIDL